MWIALGDGHFSATTPPEFGDLKLDACAFAAQGRLQSIGHSACQIGGLGSSRE